MAIKITITSVFVDNQAKALAFYADVLGFVKKNDVPVGEDRWLTVTAPTGSPEIELLLEPNKHPAAKAYQRAIYESGIPATSFTVDDIEKEYDRMTKLGVVFRGKPTPMGPVTTAIFEDTCGNLIMLAQVT